MGQAKRKQQLREIVLGACPSCIYCSGDTPAVTLDHMPPRTMFEFRQRPKGLEFASCEACNRGSSLAEQVASLISRHYPDPETEAGALEVAKLLREVHSNHPGLIAEMHRDTVIGPNGEAVMRQSSRGGAILWVGGPLVSSAMLLFVAKLAFALHYESTKRIIPQQGGVFVRWYSNHDPATDTLPTDMLTMLGPPDTLRQGRKEVSTQFTYSSKASADSQMTGHFVTFRQAFKAVMITTEKIEVFAAAEGKNTFQPGFLKVGGALPFAYPGIP